MASSRLPPDQRCDLLRCRRATFAHHPPDPDRGGLPLDAHGVPRFGREAFADRAPRLLPDHEPVARCHGLHPAGRVHHVAGDGLADLRAFAERDDRLARVHGDADRDVGVGLAERSHRAEEVERRPHRALGVVLVGHRCAEHPHRRVSDELVQRAAVALDRVLRAFVERHERATYVLGIGLVRSRREPHEVGEQDRDEASFLDRSDGRIRAASRTTCRSVRARGPTRRSADTPRPSEESTEGRGSARGRPDTGNRARCNRADRGTRAHMHTERSDCRPRSVRC